MKAPILRDASCPACSHNIAVTFLEPTKQPLATLAWPESAQEATDLEPQVLDFVRCVDCGHVFNVAFDYANVPYSQKPNLMFNKGQNWSKFLLNARSSLLTHLPENPVVVEIGHGDGHFIAALAEAIPNGRFVGFDPHGAINNTDGVELRAELFDPAVHLPELKPDLVISRHVLEHLLNPLGFLQRLSFMAAFHDLTPIAYFEVPCIDQALKSERTVDFYYEHSSQFTTSSFTRMLQTSGAKLLDIGHGYGGEVVFGLSVLGGADVSTDLAMATQDFHDNAEKALKTVSYQLSALLESGRSIAIWGGTGKSAAFMCRYGLDSKRFPVVVDSDADKVGTFVPGTGQEIRFRDWLIDNPVDVLIIPPQWRAADIISEMAGAGITAESVLIEHRGRLINFHRDVHIY